MEALRDRFFERTIHSLDLAIGPLLESTGQAVLDVAAMTVHVKVVRFICLGTTTLGERSPRENRPSALTVFCDIAMHKFRRPVDGYE